MKTQTKPRYALARRKAVELLKAAAVKSSPVPLEDLVALAGASIRYQPFAGQLSGVLHRTPNESVIGVNSLHPKTRRRFTIAHELGHLVLHKDEFHLDERFPMWLRNEVSSTATDRREIEANQFAAALLMPSELLLKDIQDLPVNIEVEDAIEHLASRYEVSRESMTFRLSALKILV